MTIAELNLIAARAESASRFASDPAGFGEIAGVATPSFFADTSYFRDMVLDNKLSERRSLLRDNGIDTMPDAEKTVKQAGGISTLAGNATFGLIGESSKEYQKALYAESDKLSDSIIMEKRTSEPSSPIAQLKTTQEIRDLAVFIRQEQNAALESAQMRAESGFDVVAGTLAGGALGVMMEPINAGSLALGASASMGVMKAMAVEGGLNAMIELAQTPENMRWAKESGVEFGLGQAAGNIALAGVGGAAITGITRGLGKLLTRGKTSEIMEKIAADENLPSELRDAAEYQARVAHIDDSSPAASMGIASDEMMGIHRRNLQEMQDALNEGREPEIDTSIFYNVLDSDAIARFSDVIAKTNPELVKVNNLYRAYSEQLGDINVEIREIEGRLSETPEQLLDPETAQRIRAIDNELAKPNISKKRRAELESEKEMLGSGTALDEAQVGTVEAIAAKDENLKRSLEIKREKIQKKLDAKAGELKKLALKARKEKTVTAVPPKAKQTEPVPELPSAARVMRIEEEIKDIEAEIVAVARSDEQAPESPMPNDAPLPRGIIEDPAVRTRQLKIELEQKAQELAAAKKAADDELFNTLGKGIKNEKPVRDEFWQQARDLEREVAKLNKAAKATEDAEANKPKDLLGGKKTKAVDFQPKPILQFLEARGGIKAGSAAAAELEQLGIKRKGLVSTKGKITSLDNIPKSEFDDWASRYDQFSEGEGDYVSLEWLRDRLDDEQRGNYFMTQKQRDVEAAKKNLDDLRSVLYYQEGVEIGQVPTEQLAAALRRASGEQGIIARAGVDELKSLLARYKADGDWDNAELAQFTLDELTSKATARTEDEIARIKNPIGYIQERIDTITDPQSNAAMLAEFDRRVAEMPDYQVQLPEGGIVSIRDLAARMREDDDVIAAVMTCGVGK